MAQYSAKISKIFTSRFGGSFGLEGHQGLYFNTKQPLPAFAVEGATVEFTGELGRNGKSFYVNDASLRLVAAQQSQQQPQSGRISTDDAIRYQSSRKDALSMVELLVSAGVLFNDKTPKAKVAGIIEDAVDRFTAIYFEDIETLGALDRVPVGAPTPTVQPTEQTQLPE